MEVRTYLERLASKAPVPGGGGTSALGGALGAALGQMVANLTVGKKKYAAWEEEMKGLLRKMGDLQERFLILSGKDEEVFAPLAEAYHLPADTEEEKSEKARVMEERLLEASQVPMEIMEVSMEMLEILKVLEEKGSVMAVSDVGVGVQFIRTALTGAAMNVFINTKSMKNREKAEELNRRAEQMTEQGTRTADQLYEKVFSRLR